MKRSDLISRIAEQQEHLPDEDVETVVKSILEQLSAALANGERSRFGISEASPCTIDQPDKRVTQKPANRCIPTVVMRCISSQGRNCANG